MSGRAAEMYRDFGRRLRKFRDQAGLTQQRLSTLSGISRPWIAAIESGRADPRLSDAVRLAEVVVQRVSGRTLAEVVLGTDAGQRFGREEQDDSVKRREFLRWSTVMAGIALSDAEQFALAMDPNLMGDLSRLNLDFGRLSRTASPRSLLPVLRNQLAYVRHLLDRTSGQRRRDLLSIAGEASALAGNLAFRGDNRGDAQLYLRHGIDLAKEAGDANLHALALTMLRNTYSSVPSGGVGGNTELALAAAEEAYRVAGPQAPPILLTYILVSRAEEHSVLGDERAARRDLEAADRAFARVEVGQLDGYFYHWDAVRLASWRGNCELVLGNAKDAVAVLDPVCAHTSPELIGFYASATADLAAGYALVGEIDQACTLLHRSLDVAAPAGVVATGTSRVAGVRRRHLPRGTRLVETLDERLRLLSAGVP